MDTHKEYLDKIPIKVNGVDRYATGLSKTTTIDEIKYAMLSVSEPTFRAEDNVNYGVFEKWNGHERLLEGKSKIYKVISFWKSLPGDQLSQVKFIIKKKKHAKTVLKNKENYFMPDCSDDMEKVDGQKLKCSLIDLVNRQNEFISGQLTSLSSEDDRVKCDDLREKILEAIELELVQNEKIEWLNDSLKQIGELIEMKKEFVSKIEQELSDNDNDDDDDDNDNDNERDKTEIRISYEPKKEIIESNERPIVSVMSTTTSSIFTSVSSTSITDNYVVVKDSIVSTDEVIPLETLV